MAAQVGAMKNHSFAKLLFACLMLGFIAAGRAAFTAAEKIRLHGRIFDAASRSPLPGATVFLPSVRRGAVANGNGEFSIENLAPGTYKIICQYLGYTNVELALALSKDTEQDFYLQPATLKGAEVTITAEREKFHESKQAVTILTPQDLDKIRGQTLGETLKEIPGVATLQTGPSLAKPVIRGLHSQRVLVLNAGVPQEGQQWGGEHAPEIDPFAPARIEVLKGAAGVEYGVGAIGGVIRIIPRELPASGLDGELTVNAFSNNRQGAGSLLLEGANQFISGLGWRVQGSLRKAGDAHSPQFNMQNTGFEEADYSATLGYEKGRGRAQLIYSHFGTTLGIYRGAHLGNVTDLRRAIAHGQPAAETEFSYDIKGPKQEISHNLLSMKAEYGTAAGRLEMQYGWQQNHRREFDAHQPFSSEPPAAPSLDLTLTTYTLDLALRHVPFKNIFGRIGLAAMRQGNVQTGTVLLIPNFRSHSGGAFLHETWTNGRLTLDAGLRCDYRRVETFVVEDNPETDEQTVVSRLHEYSNVSGVAGLVYQFASAWSLGANAATAWRPPSLNELYSNGVHHGAAQFEIGNLNLKSERSLGFEATLRHASARTSFELSAYHTRFDGFIHLFPDPEPTLTIRGAFPTFRYLQAGAALHGFEAAFERRLAPFFELGATAALVRGQNLDEDEPLYQMPADRLRLRAGFHLPRFSIFDDAHVELATTLVAEQKRFPANTDYAAPPAGYALNDLIFSAQILLGKQPARLTLGLRNLFNVSYRDYLSRYRYFIDDAGRDFVLRVHLPFGDHEHHAVAAN